MPSLYIFWIKTAAFVHFEIIVEMYRLGQSTLLIQGGLKQSAVRYLRISTNICRCKMIYYSKISFKLSIRHLALVLIALSCLDISREFDLILIYETLDNRPLFYFFSFSLINLLIYRGPVNQ